MLLVECHYARQYGKVNFHKVLRGALNLNQAIRFKRICKFFSLYAFKGEKLKNHYSINKFKQS